MDEKFFKSTLIEHFEISHNENEDANKILKERLKTYDFTDNWRKTEVDRLWKLKHSRYSSLPTFTKYFIYKLSGVNLKKNKIREQKYYYPRFYEAWKEQISSDYIEYMVDPDSESEILQGIYEYLWGGTILEKCTTEEEVLRISLNELELEKVKVIKGDTLNSAQTTLSHFFRNKYSKDEQYYASTKLNGYTKYNKKKQIVSCNGHLWHCIDIYLNEEKKINDEIKNAENNWCIIEEFLRVNHTLGNFMPVPSKFNTKRNESFKDYWDKTLYIIYNWYKKIGQEKKSTEVDKLLQKLNEECIVDWLSAFRDEKGNPSWNVFVEKNYLQPFVYKISETEYGYPKCFFLYLRSNIYKKNENKINCTNDDLGKKFIEKLWEECENGSLIPKNEAECIEFFKNVTSCVKARTELMLNKLMEELNKKKSD